MDVNEGQWTGAARRRYQDAATHLMEALAAHIDLVAGGSGDPSELGPYLLSTKRLVPIVDTFRRAEFDLCGEYPLDDFAWPDSESDLDGEDGPAADGDLDPGPTVSVVHRMEFEVLDQVRLLEAGRAAQHAWSQDEPADEPSPADAGAAVAALLHTHGPAALAAGQGYLARRWTEISVLQREPID